MNIFQSWLSVFLKSLVNERDVTMSEAQTILRLHLHFQYTDYVIYENLIPSFGGLNNIECHYRKRRRWSIIKTLSQWQCQVDISNCSSSIEQYRLNNRKSFIYQQTISRKNIKYKINLYFTIHKIYELSHISSPHHVIYCAVYIIILATTIQRKLQSAVGVQVIKILTFS